jgi:hypothetical protein
VLWDEVWDFSSWFTSLWSVVMTFADALAASSAASFANACASVVGVFELLMAAMVILLARETISAALSKY